MRNNKREINIIIIACEGITEEKYFREMCDCLRNNSIRICPVCVDGEQRANEFMEKVWKAYLHEADFRPRKVVQSRKPYKGDEVWCIYDEDDKSRGNLITFAKLAEQYEFKPIYSLPSFELWFYLHFFSLPINVDGLKKLLANNGIKANTLHQNEMLKLLKTVWSRYKKAKREEQTKYLETLGIKEKEAVLRAVELHRLHTAFADEPYTRPDTNVHEIVERLRKAKK